MRLQQQTAIIRQTGNSSPCPSEFSWVEQPGHKASNFITTKRPSTLKIHTEAGPMVSQAIYASNSPTDGRRNYRTYHDPYHYSVDRRYSASHPQSPHSSRALNMTDHQGESDSSNQRKRISVAVSLQSPAFLDHVIPASTIQTWTAGHASWTSTRFRRRYNRHSFPTLGPKPSFLVHSINSGVVLSSSAEDAVSVRYDAAVIPEAACPVPTVRTLEQSLVGS